MSKSSSDSMPENRYTENSRSLSGNILGVVCVLVLFACFAAHASLRPALAQNRRQQGRSKPTTQARAIAIPSETMLRIVRAEDERRWNDSLAPLLADASARVRERAALAAGRIGDVRAVAALAALLQSDADESVRAMAAFALGEVESDKGTDALASALVRATETSAVRT